MEKSFKLRGVIQCHSMDIRCVAGLAENGFVTGSRDKLCKVYLPQKNSKTFNEIQCFSGPEHFVSSICVLCNKVTNESIIFVGSNDSVIYAFTIEESSPKAKLQGHSGTVCALAACSDRGFVGSGSWDNTAMVWKDFNLKSTFVGHSAAVWAVDFLGDDFLTASADKTLKLWDIESGSCKHTFTGHTDCVRGISVLSNSEFISCSNDATVRHWHKDGESKVYYGHENFIYSISAISDLEFVTCSEDRTARIWNSGNVVQTIRLPAPTLWAVSTFQSNNFVVAASDGKVYLFTRDSNFQASPEEQRALEEEVSKSTVPVNELGDIKVSDLPGKEVLYAPGKKEGQTKLVRDGSNVIVFQWSTEKMEWMKVGDVVGAASPNKDPSQKTTYEGKEYDYVFDVDIKDGEPPLKLPFNVNGDPWVAAQEFIHKHNLSQYYLDQIANFIIKNSQATVIKQTNNAEYDPFTGGSRYVPGSSDPPSTESYFPQRDFVFFEQANIEGIAKKLKEFSEQVPPEVQITKGDIQTLLKLTDITSDLSNEQIALIKLLISWPKQYLFPALDLLRMALLLPKVNEALSASKDSVRMVDTLLISATDANSTPNQICALRALSNLFSHSLGQALMISHAGVVFKAISECKQSTNKNVQIACSTIYINYSVVFSKEQNESIQM
ncbi:phospholipase A-2-activating protein-like protein, partial [Leptotrombidium deliense]